MSAKEKIRALRPADLETILDLTRGAGWISDVAEFELHRRLKSAVAAVLVAGDSIVGCVTAFTHKKTAWIGNLIVHPDWRRQGFGTELFAYALDWVGTRERQIVLLTAAPQAKSIYERFDFRAIGEIVRRRRPAGPDLVAAKAVGDRHNFDKLVHLDSQCWADDRSRLLRSIKSRRLCVVTADHAGFAMVDKTNATQTIGPAIAPGETAADYDELIDGALSRLEFHKPVVLDTFSENAELNAILEAKGFEAVSRTTLMCRGPAPDIKFGRIAATASLGSMG